jgi:hypothetical protein
MRLFRRQADELETRLRARRREPRDEFVAAIVSSVSERGSRHPLRLVFAGATAVVGLAMFGAFGGLSYASSATQSVVDAITPSGGKTSSTGTSSGTTLDANAPSTAQYVGKTTICHRRPNGSYVVITVNNTALPTHKAHEDTLPAEDGTCPGPEIP